MRCPRCETSTLDEREREGVTIDVCRDCRGLWLDRGELEKLIARERRSFDDDRDSDHGRERNRDSDHGRERDRDSDHCRDRWRDRERDARDDRPYRRRKSWFESLGDLFD